MRFAAFVEALDRAEETPSRLETSRILSEALTQLDGEDLAFAVHFLQGQLGPSWRALPIGIGDKNVVKAVAALADEPEEDVEQRMRGVGDLGLVAADAVKRARQRPLFSEPLEIASVRAQLDTIARASGKGSGERKLKIFQELLSSATPSEAKYLVRFVLGKMRVGIGEGAIIEALAWMLGERKRKGEVEEAYNRRPDLADIAARLKAGGFEALKDVRVTPLVPLRPMLAERLRTTDEILEKLEGRAAFDFKYDGLRMQVHYRNGEVAIFSRNLESYTEQFPDVVELVKSSARARDFIVEGEGVTVDLDTGEIRPFQEASRRRGRKHDLQAKREELPFALYLFDCMYLDGEDLTGRLYEERRRAITKAVEEKDQLRTSTMKVVASPQEAERFFMEALATGCEGIIAKSLGPDGTYRAGARGWAWIKFKRDYSAALSDTVDLVVVGAFAGRGRRTGHYGSLVMAARDPDSGRLESLCKLATGFDDAELAANDALFKPLVRKERHPKVDSGLEPDFWLEPQVVMEVRGAELTLSPVHRAAFGKVREGAGLAMRFPRFEKIRTEKSEADATTTEELLEMYRQQYAQRDKRAA